MGPAEYWPSADASCMWIMKLAGIVENGLVDSILLLLE
jgi:hypothetical protein